MPRIILAIILITAGIFVFKLYYQPNGVKPSSSIIGNTQSTSPSLSQSAPNALKCLNQYKDEENHVSFCMPVNYQKVANDKKVDFAKVSFTPIQNISCSFHDGNYCDVLFFSYYLGDTEIPPKFNADGRVDSTNETLQTDSGETMKIYSPFSPSIGERIYSYKLKSNKYAYFFIISSHPKKDATELNNQLSILKSVKQF